MWRPLGPGDIQRLLGMIIQGTGIAVLALIFLFLNRSLRRTTLAYWAYAWCCLAFALTALFLSFRLVGLERPLESVYYFAEYAFGVLLIAGLRHYATGQGFGRKVGWLVVPGIALAVVLPYGPKDFSLRFAPQSLVLAALFAAAFVQLELARRRRGSTPGARITAIGLLLLSVNFLHYPPVFIFAATHQIKLPLAYSAYTSIYDLILEVVLGFGILTLVLEDVNAELTATNSDLREARDRVEKIARLDPLTESLNRHAFYSLVEGNRKPSETALAGCVGLVDVDDLKPINDSYGHAAGDLAIRKVASAIRAGLRADDLVFRWGGDEFLVLLFGVSEEETRRRLEGLNEALRDTSLPGAPSLVSISVSFGVAPFSRSLSLERAIENADDAMYRCKEERKQRARASG